MSEGTGTQLREFLDARRGDSRPEDLVREWVAAGRDYRERRERLRSWITTRGSAVGGQFFSSPDLVDFMGQLATADHRAQSVLDPVCGSGYLLSTVADATGASVIHGVDINPVMSDLARLLLPESAEVFTGDVLADDVPLNPQYDLVVGEPPFGLRLSPRWPLPGADDFLVSHFSNALAWRSSLKLSSRGAAVLLLPSSFIHERAKRGWGIVEDQRIYVRACVHVPRGSIQGTGAEAYVVVVDRQEREEIFAAQFTPDAGHQGTLIENFAAHRHARLASQGRLWSWESFTGFGAIETRERVRAVGKRMGLTPVAIRELVTEHHVLRPPHLKTLEVKPNAVYLPLGRAGAAVTEPAELPAGTKQYLQLYLDAERADARYVAGLLDQELGQALLDGARGGSAAGVLLPARLMELDLYLPDLETQRRIADTVTEARRHRAEPDELEHGLWTSPAQAEQIATKIASFRREDRFDDWLETLPFPLASVLWRYRAASGSTRERYEALLHFFEALAEFVATVHLSAFSSDTEMWSQHRSELRSVLEGRGLRIAHGTFGAWKCVCEFLGARLRRMMDKASDSCAALYRTHNPQTLGMLASSELLKVLQQANSVRNDWHGHVGAVGEKQAETVHAELLTLVQQTRGVFGRAWLDYELIQPSEARFRDGLFRYRVRRLQGTRSAPFESVERDGIEPMEDRALYMLDPSSDRGLRLLPFVRVMPSPRTEANACYFFNRLESNDRFRYVSYHFAQDAEFTDGSEDTRDALNGLGLAGFRAGDG